MTVLFSGADPLWQFGRGSSKKHFCEIVLKSAFLALEEMLFNCFFVFFLLWWPFCSAEQNNFSNFGRGSSKEHFCEIILKSTHWPWRRGHLKGFSIFSSGGHFFSAVRNHFSNFGRGSSKEHFCEIILKSTHWPWRRGHLKGFSIFSSGGHFIQQCGIILAILVEGHPKNICVKLF